MKQFIKLMLAIVFPVWLLDSCANRDPGFYLDERSQLVASWPSAPLTFTFRGKRNGERVRIQLDDITEFLMNESLFTGKTGEDYFIVRRPLGEKSLFDTQTERNQALKRDFATSLGELHERPWYARLRGNSFFPYNLIFYITVTGTIGFICFFRRRT